MVKVLEILPTLNRCGGAEAYATNYCFRLAPSLFHVDYIIHGTPKEDNYILEAKKHGSEVFDFPNFSPKNRPLIKKRFLEVLSKNSYDIIHSHQANTAFFYFPLAKKYVPHRILHSHQSKAADKLSHAIRNKPLLALGRHYATDYRACSLLAGKYLFKKRPFKVLNNAVDSPLFFFNGGYREEIRNRYHIPFSSFVIGHIGRRCPQKNQKFLISLRPEILKRHPDTYLRLVGEGEDREAIELEVQKLGIEKNVILCGPSSTAYKFYSAFDILVLPSLYEGIPTVGIEATYADLNVVTSDRVTKELNFYGNVVYLPLSDPKGKWAEEILSLIKNPSLRKKVDCPEYDINSQSSCLAEYYNSLIVPHE